MSKTKMDIKLPVSRAEILSDYQLIMESREASLMGRKEVFMGKAKFGIFGDGKELPQVAMAKYFHDGDWRAGYYRDQTFMMSIGQLTTQQFFAQLYAHTSVEAEPASGGRMMNGHFATRYLNDRGEWLTQTDKKNSSADISPTAGQMPRLLGLAYASKLYRNNKELNDLQDFSIHGNEVAFGTIGNASTSEGHFWETLNAAGVLQVPMVISIWDDEYGISVPQSYHTIKEDLSEALSGFQRTTKKRGFELFKVKAWDYPALLATYKQATDLSRKSHVPCLIHVVEATQPQGHSTSGSHERYKSKKRLEWEQSHDCVLRMREWMLGARIAKREELDRIEKKAKANARQAKALAWKDFTSELKKNRREVLELIGKMANGLNQEPSIDALVDELSNTSSPGKSDVMRTARKALRVSKHHPTEARKNLVHWVESHKNKFADQYHSHLHSQSPSSALRIEAVPAVYSDKSPLVDGREILNAGFDLLLQKDKRLFALGEDIGKIGDVNQGFAGLQKKHGALRVTDTGIRETTIIGQGIGAAIRGLRPIAEIQYLDYLLYAIQTLSDDLATLLYRTKGGQKAPLIIRTRGHRLEGVWHSGSPMGMILHALRGIYVLTPRNMTQAVGFYNTLMDADEPALVIESLNGYRLKERVPENLSEFRLALGIPEILREGTDVTVVTYGSTCRIVEEAAGQLLEEGIRAEIIDAQTLIPFDRHQVIRSSLQKTNRLVIVDEDVSGGASAYIMQQILEKDNGYFYMDSKPLSITGKDHRPAYGSDGDYFSKPNVEDVIEGIYSLMTEVDPVKYPAIF